MKTADGPEGELRGASGKTFLLGARKTDAAKKIELQAGVLQSVPWFQGEWTINQEMEYVV